MNANDRRLVDAVTYDPNTGLFTGEYRHTSGVIKRRKFTNINADGYLKATICRRTILLHRLAWLCYYGEWPSIIDHINRIKTDNRIANLRVATVRQNTQNQGRSPRNTTGFKGVTYNRQAGKFQAAIGVNNKLVYLGLYPTAVEAAKAYDTAGRKEFGEFVVTNFEGAL